MNSQRTKRLLIIAFAISLLIHLVIASGVRWPFTPSKEETTVVSIRHVRTLRVTRLPTPPPQTPPPVTPSPLPSAPPTAKPNPRPARSAAAVGIGGQKPPGGAQTPAPPTATPKPSPTPNCATSDTTALLTETPPPPDIAPDARGAATSGTTTVRVSLDADGVVHQATVVESSGNTSLDLVAVSMARAARYTPATHACKPIASEYMFRAKFSAW